MTRIRNKNKRQENKKILLTNNKNQEKMKHLMKGIRIAAYIAEIIVAGSTIVELVEYSSKRKKKDAASKVDTGNVATENP